MFWAMVSISWMLAFLTGVVAGRMSNRISIRIRPKPVDYLKIVEDAEREQAAKRPN